MKPLKLYAIVKRKNPRLKYIDLFDFKDIKCDKDEKVIEVEVKEIMKIK